jgi:ElaB/YqjD/DUF883 family membrane-anchored ribosome-binding protein
MAQRSDEIRGDIVETREEMGATVDALAYKADVPGRAKDWLDEKKDAVSSKVTGLTPDGEQVKRRLSSAKDSAERNPIGLAIGGAAVGFVLGLLTPSTRMEDERLGPMADDVKSSAAEAGREALDRGRQVVEEAGESAVETAKQRAGEESQELTSSLQDKARDVASPGSDAETQARAE